MVKKLRKRKKKRKKETKTKKKKKEKKKTKTSRRVARSSNGCDGHSFDGPADGPIATHRRSRYFSMEHSRFSLHLLRAEEKRENGAKSLGNWEEKRVKAERDRETWTKRDASSR